MEHYDELKMTPLYNGQTLRNMMEHLGTEGIRYYDNDFWAKCLLREIEKHLKHRIYVFQTSDFTTNTKR